MDFVDELRALQTRLRPRLEHLQTEEATKMSLIVPFIRFLGYNVFEPTEVEAEFTADIGTKKGEKVDYAIKQDGKVIILVECKQHGVNIDNPDHWNQLARYFMVSNSHFGILTEGQYYRFYADLETPGKIDEKPFLSFDILALSDGEAEELKRFTKEEFQEQSLLDAARMSKYIRGIIRTLEDQMREPDDDFVRFFISKVYPGRPTQSIRQQFKSLTRQAVGQFITTTIQDRLALISTLETPEREQGQEPIKREPRPAASVKIADAIYAVLQEAGESMHVQDITQRISTLDVRLSQETPARTVNSTLSRDPRFVRVDKGTWTLQAPQPKGVVDNEEGN